MANIVEQIKYKRKELSPHKSIIDPKFDAKTVLTNNPWSFVSLWLKREKKKKKKRKGTFLLESSRNFL